MAYYNKIGLLLLNEERTSFMVCVPGEAYTDKRVTQYLLPGGQLEESSDLECLKREIKEELDCGLDESSVAYIGEYTDVSASSPDRDVMIRLYEGRVIGDPKPSSEIGAFAWIGKGDIENPRVSPIIKNKIIPDLVMREILK